MSLLVEAVLKTSAIIAIGIAARSFMRKHSAAARHWLLAAAFASAATVPFLGLVMPRWPAHVPALLLFAGPQQAATAAVGGVAAADAPGAGTVLYGRDPDEVSRGQSSWAAIGTVVGSIWLAGTLVCLGMLLVGLCRLARLTAGARPIVNGPCVVITRQLARASRLRRDVELLQADRPTQLMTWGALRPAIILPAGAPEWPDDRLRVVLAHELAHIRRGDWVVLMLAALMQSVYWFNPLIWLACAHLREDGECACDDAVLSAGVSAPECARQLLEVARASSTLRRSWLLGAAIAQESNLERRIRAMLNSRTNRAPMSSSARALTLGAIVAIAVALGGFGAEGQGRSSAFSGVVVDPLNGVMPDTTLVLVNSTSQAKHEIRTDGSGRFRFVDLPAGEYTFEARRPGFATMKGRITIEGKDIERELTLQVGSVAETVVVSGGSAAAAPAVQRLGEKRDATGCVPSAVGGVIRPPRKVVEVRPLYPERLRTSGEGGEVRLDARIATDGTVREIQVLSTPHAELTASAVEAVRQWEYDFTLLNCKPIELTLHVTVRFAPGR